MPSIVQTAVNAPALRQLEAGKQEVQIRCRTESTDTLIIHAMGMSTACTFLAMMTTLLFRLEDKTNITFHELLPHTS